MSGYECSMVCHKLYSEISPTEELKEGVAVGEEVGPEDETSVGPDDKATEGRNDGATEGPGDGATVGRDDGTVVGLEDGVVVRAGLYSHPQRNCC